VIFLMGTMWLAWLLCWLLVGWPGCYAKLLVSICSQRLSVNLLLFSILMVVQVSICIVTGLIDLNPPGLVIFVSIELYMLSSIGEKSKLI
jgi:hypothetical protein